MQIEMIQAEEVMTMEEAPATEGVQTAGRVLKLSGGVSYVTSPINLLGNGNQLSFDVRLTEKPQAGDILFEADVPYGTHDIRIMEDGTLGFTRELHSYCFGCELPVGERVNIRITTEQQRTKLYVNDEFISDARGKFLHNGMVKKDGIENATFALPLKRIGSRTRAIKAEIGNVTVSEKTEYQEKISDVLLEEGR